MKKLLEFTSEDGSTFFLETEDTTPAQNMRGSNQNENNQVIQAAGESFSKAIKPLKEISSGIISNIQQIVNSPDEVEVEMGLKFNTKAGIIITSLESEATIKIVLKWRKDKTT